jgi:dipeptidase
MISKAVQLFLLEKMPHMMARTDDSGAGRFDPRKYIIVKPSDQPLHYKSVFLNLK